MHIFTHVQYVICIFYVYIGNDEFKIAALLESNIYGAIMQYYNYVSIICEINTKICYNIYVLV